MKIGIMQPYFFPYLGYWQLLAAVDKYVIYDDVNFIKGGWINRNRILNNCSVQYINVRMKGASSFKKINEIEVDKDPVFIEKTKKTIINAYHKAPEFNKVYPLIESVLDCKEKNLALYLINSIYRICTYLEINTELIISSNISKDELLRGEDKVIDICKKMNATIYYNAIGGKSLYDFARFREEGINLVFLKERVEPYKQNCKKFESGLSIIDVMMYNSVYSIKDMLVQYDLEYE